MRPAAAVVSCWLAATLPLALAGARHVEAGAAFAAVHVAALALCGVAAFRPGGARLRPAADWIPLALVPLLYAELPQLMAGAGATMNDALVIGWESAWFGEPSRQLAARFPWPWLSEPLHLAYFLYYPLIYVPPALLYLRLRRGEFQETAAALLTAFVVCFAVFVVFPVAGPRYAGAAPAPDGFVRSLVLQVLEAGSSRGAAFPSSHVAVAVVQVGMAWRRGSRLTPLYAVLTLLLSLGAVYGGFHYGVDVVAGALSGAALVAAFHVARAWRAVPAEVVSVPAIATSRDQTGV